MCKALLIVGFLLGLSAPAWAQVPCVGVGGVNNVPQAGVTCGQEPAINTYAATSVGLIPAAAATDIACIAGKANVVMRMQAIGVSGSGTAISVPVLLRKNASLDTGGTPATSTALPVAYPLDSSYTASGATLVAYTANPTVNDTTPGLIDSGNLGLVATTVGAAVQSAGVLFDYSRRSFMAAPILRKAAEQICVNLNGTTPTALLNVSFKWTESPQ